MSEVPAPPSTDIEEVDAVLATVAGLDDRPVAEHAAAFEAAHAVLRRTLDDPPTPA
ncbi:hypothetical protein [Nocardioides sp. YIM 152588]|uniref:hypothetical protein n=1 Tax=Nocardioides sp. YIM 152588 TaxID=3158259 RepID=UPI0032E3A45B